MQWGICMFWRSENVHRSSKGGHNALSIWLIENLERKLGFTNTNENRRFSKSRKLSFGRWVGGYVVVKPHFFTKTGKNSCFYTKISELFAWNSGNREPSFTKTGQFHAKRVSFTQNGKFTQKISELSKKSVIIFWRSGQFHAKTVKNVTKLVSRWSKLPCFFERREFW